MQAALFEAQTWEAQLLADLAPLIPEMSGRQVHLAILQEPYMGRVERGEKTIESRWSKVLCAPHGWVVRQDILVFKRTGGPIRGWCEVLRTAQFDLHEISATEIIAANQPDLGVGDDFAAAVANKRHVTLMTLGAFHPLDAGHVTIRKRDRRGWVVLGRMP